VLSFLTTTHYSCDLAGKTWLKRSIADEIRAIANPTGKISRNVIGKRSRDGAGGRIRTADPLITNQVHYQLCYTGFLTRVAA
jgi:hypothetical protein